MRKLARIVLSVLSIIAGIFGIASALSMSMVGGLVYFLAAVFLWPSVGERIKGATGRSWLAPVAGLLIAIFIAPVVVVLTAPTNEELAAKDAQRIAKEEKNRQLAREVAEQERAERIREAEQFRKNQLESYIAQLDREIARIPSIKVTDYKNRISVITAELAVIEMWGRIYERGGQLALDQAAEAKRQEFRRLAVKKQAEMLPRLRDIYGPAMRRELWEVDGSARTIGAGFRTVEFVSFEFARNANIKAVNDSLYKTLMMLRFNQARYKWSAHVSEYTYYDLDSPGDSDLVVWRDDGRFDLH